MGLEPDQIFFQNFFSTNMVARGVHLTEKFWQLPAYVRMNRPNSYKRRWAIARIFQLNEHKSKTTQDIDLKFSAFVHHMSGLN